MGKDWTAGLTDSDDLDQLPSAARPLEQAGIDPLMARANPSILTAGLMGGAGQESAAPQLSAVSSQPSAGATAPQTTAAGAPMDAGGYGLAGLGMLNKNLESATQAADEVPTTNPDLDRLTAQRDKLAQAPELYNPQTGKMNAAVQEFDPATGSVVTVNPRPGAGTRIWRGIRGGLEGLATGGIRGALFGALDPGAEPGDQAYGAPNTAFQKAEEARTNALGQTDTEIGQAREAWKSAQDAAKARASEFRANATLGRDEETGAENLLKAGTADKQADTARLREENQTPEAKAELSQKELENRQKWVNGNGAGLSPLQKLLYVLNGKVPDPREPNEAEINAAQAARALQIFRQGHGGRGPQTLDEFNEIQQAARGTLGRGGRGGGGADEADAIQQDALRRKDQFMQGYQHLQDGRWAPTSGAGQPLTPEEMAQRLDGFRTEANTKLARLGYKIDAGAGGQWTMNAAGQQAGGSAGQQPNVDRASLTPPAGATGQVKNRKTGRMHWVNMATHADLGEVGGQ